MRRAIVVSCIILVVALALVAQREPRNEEEPVSTGETAAAVSVSDLAATAYRGVNINPELIQEGDVEILALEWGANLIRACLASSDCGLCMTTDGSPTCRSIDFAKLDSIVDWCEEYGIRVVIDLHHFAGYNPHSEPQDFRLWDSPALQQKFVDFWRSVARRYASRGDVIYGYDLLNEPHTSSKGIPRIWNSLIERTAKAIREVDNRHAIVVECGYGLPENFMPLQPIDDPNIIYSFHFGEPYMFTHQGHMGKPAGLKYPSSDLDKDYLRSLIKPAYEFKKRYGVQIYVGELIVYCYVDSTSRSAYMRDCLDLFEEYGFDYTFWAYRSWLHSSLEHVGYKTPKKWIEEYVGETESLLLFQGYLDRNELPIQQPVPVPKPRCLFDTAHWPARGESNIRSLNLAWRLTGMCEVDYHRGGRISEAALQGVDLLVTGAAHGTRYNEAEATAIVEFVRDGGALFFYGTKDWGNSLFLGDFGIQIDPTVVHCDDPVLIPSDSRTYYVTSFAGPLEAGVPSFPFAMNYGASLDLSEPAQGVAYTNAEAWRDTNGNGRKDAGEELGPFAVIAISECGTGRVVVVADDEFRNNCTWPTQSAAIAWLLDN
jgi:cellulase (glycosyl hydrolase family 5)